MHKLISAIKLTKINKQGSDISSRLTLMIFDTFAKPLKNYLNFQVDTNKCQFKKKLASITRIPANKYMLKVNNKNSKKNCGNYSKLTVMTLDVDNIVDDDADKLFLWYG